VTECGLILNQWILANKSDVIDWAVKQGYSETGMWVAIDSINNVLYLEKE
jgi:hypothetical protein